MRINFTRRLKSLTSLLFILLTASACLENSSSLFEESENLDSSELELYIYDLRVREENTGTKSYSLNGRLSEAFNKDIKLSIITEDNTAKKSIDYNQIIDEFIIPSGKTEFSFIAFEIIGEELFETDESFYIKIDPSIDIDDSKSKLKATVVIEDDESTPSISIDDASANELEKALFKVRISKPSQEDIIINYSFIESGKALEGRDFDPTPGSVILKGGDLDVEIPVLFTYDSLYEDTEDFSVQISTSAPVVVARGTAIGSIMNINAAPEINFEASAVEFYETQGSINVTFAIDSVAGKDVQIPIEVVSNELLSIEHSSIPSMGLISEGSLSGSISFDIYDDELMENSEKILIGFASSIEDAIPGVTNQIEISIAESDALPENLSNLTQKSLGFVINGQYYKDSIDSLVAGDMNGDGSDDLIIWNQNGITPNLYSRLYMLYGKDQKVLADIDLNGSSTVNDLVYITDTVLTNAYEDVFSFGDVNCDGLDDIFYVNEDRHIIWGSQTKFTSMSTISGIKASSKEVNTAKTLSVGDINGDGCNDLGFADHNFELDVSTGDVTREGKYGVILSDSELRSNTILYSLSAVDFYVNGSSSEQRLGIHRNSSEIGDLNADGYDDMLIAQAQTDVFIYWGGETLPANHNSSSYSTYGIKLISGTNDYFSYTSMPIRNQVVDFNFDGIEDTYLLYGRNATLVALPGKTSGWTDNSNFFSPPYGDGTNAEVFELERKDEEPDLVVADLNADGYLDIIYGMPVDDSVSSRLATIYVKWGVAHTEQKTKILDTYDHKIVGELQGWNLSNMETGDLNGDGIQDLVLNFNDAEGLAYQSGKIYVIYGGNLTNSIDFLGTDGVDTLEGTSLGEVFFGGSGDDLIVGAGGADYLQGGAGNDEFRVEDYDFKAIDGGPGFDTIQLNNFSLDVSNAAVAKFRNVEAFNLKTSTSSEILSLSHVFSLRASKNKRTYVRCGSEDVVNISGVPGSWSTSSNESKDSVIYRLYTHTKSVAKIFVENGCTVNLP